MHDIRAYLDILLEHTFASFQAFDIDAEILRRLAADGFDIDEPLFHGSSSEFTAFDRKFAKSASDIYTSPDPETAAFYGDFLYLCVGRQDPQADLTDDYVLLGRLAEEFADDYFHEHVIEDDQLKALRVRIAKELAAKNDDDDPSLFLYDAEEDPRYKQLWHKLAYDYALEYLQDGKIYEYDFHGRLQDTIMQWCFRQGFRSVCFYDYSSQGTHLSIVFDKAEDVAILRRIDSLKDATA